MSFHATTLKLRCLVLCFFSVASLSAFSQAPDQPAQATDFPVTFASPGGITTTLVDPPSAVGGSNSPGSNSGNTQWLKVEFHYSVTPAKDKGDYLDSVQFKVWIEGRDLMAPDAPGADGLSVGLTGSVTYVNVLKGKDVYGVFFVHPSTLGRYSGKGGADDFTRKFNIHLEALVDGKIVDNIDKIKESDLKWFETLKAVSGLVYRQDQSPFLLSDVSHYPAIKLSESGQ